MVVVGGGITGLATAWYLRSVPEATRPEVVVVEASERVGGKIRTETLGGVPVEAGPDTFLAREPWGTDLACKVGLADDLVAPATGAAFVCHDGRLQPLPRGTVLGVPVTARTLLGTSLLSPAGRARAALDLVLPRRRLGADPSVADVIAARLGPEVLERMVEPLVGGINAGRAENLSLRSVAASLAAAAEQHRSMILGLRADRRAATGTAPPGPLFLAVAGGMERLVERLASSLEGVELRTATAVTDVTKVRPDGGSRWQVACDRGPDVEADAVVLTIPAFAAAPVVAAVSPEAAAELAGIRYASVVTATLAYRREALPRPLVGSGFLVPRGEKRLLTACTFSTSKWPDLARSGMVLLRASAGRDGDDEALGLDDDALITRLHQDLSVLVGVTEAPVSSRVDRWENGFPQYEPGHDARIDRIEAALGAHGALVVAGAAFRGVGIAACVQQASAAAARVGGLLADDSGAARET